MNLVHSLGKLAFHWQYKLCFFAVAVSKTGLDMLVLKRQYEKVIG